MNDEQSTALMERTGQPERAISAFASEANFEAAKRMAMVFTSSSLAPKEYRDKAGIANTLIAMELANRIGASPLMVMQNLHIVNGRPGWASSFLIATVNASGRFSPLRFRFEGEEGKESWGCRAYAKDSSTGEECLGSLITIGMAKVEGWSTKSGSKWKTMPEQMLRYRAAAFWTRVYCPEISLGIHTADEVTDMTATGRSVGATSLNEALESEGFQVAEVVDEETGEITEDLSPPTDAQINQLRDLMDKAGLEFEEAEAYEILVKDKDGPGVRDSIRTLNRRLLDAQGDLLEEK